MSSPGRFAIFAEGPYPTEDRGCFVELWSLLARRCGVEDSLRVVGFCKAELVALAPPPKWSTNYEPLDIKIANESSGTENLIIAFDMEPKRDKRAKLCRPEEMAKYLEALSQSERLPSRFREAASSLHKFYRSQPKPLPRAPGRPPRKPLEIIAMEPMFEALLLADEAGVKEVLKAGTTRSWPSFRSRSAKPDRDILTPAIQLADVQVRRKVRGTFETNKHGWAEYILRQLPEDSPAWRHGIVERLRLLLQ